LKNRRGIDVPELPEVETIVRGLQKAVSGTRITGLKLSDKKLRSKPVIDFSSNILNQVIKAVIRRGKYIIMALQDGGNIIIHLGMSGKLLVGRDIKTSIHDHARIFLADGNNIVFNDPRRFGIIAYTKHPADNPLLKNLGVEPLAKEFTHNQLADILIKRKAAIKSVLMNANLIVGIGNIYVCESLFYSGIHPQRLASTITKAEAAKLVSAIKVVLEEAIASGGSTLRDYVSSDGDVGGFQHKFAVYGRKDKPCLKCGSEIKILKIAGRSTYYCHSCQKITRRTK
jgi:formamidopyrimidine-DNA glycosylase